MLDEENLKKQMEGAIKWIAEYVKKYLGKKS